EISSVISEHPSASRVAPIRSESDIDNSIAEEKPCPLAALCGIEWYRAVQTLHRALDLDRIEVRTGLDIHGVQAVYVVRDAAVDLRCFHVNVEDARGLVNDGSALNSHLVVAIHSLTSLFNNLDCCNPRARI